MSITDLRGSRMPSWFDRRGAMPFNVPGPCKTEFEGLEASRAAIEALIDQERTLLAKTLLISEEEASKRIVLSGFSQGACLTLYCGAQSRFSLGGLLPISGYIPVADSSQFVCNEANANTPITIVHGDADMTVSHQAAEHARSVVMGARAKSRPADVETQPVEVKIIPDLPHSINAEVLQISIDCFATWIPKL